MKRKISIQKLMGALLIAALIFCLGSNAAPALHVAPVVAGGIGAGLYLATLFLPKPATYDPNVMSCGIQKEVWENRIEENLFNDNEFLLASVDDSEYESNRTVHIPNAGATPNVEVNRAKGGARTDPSQREDTEVTYDIDELTTDPFLITDAEEKELSYGKVDSVLYDHQMILNDTFAKRTMIAWAPTGTALLADGLTTNANILRSTGIPNNDPAEAIVTSAAYLTGATGARKNYGIYDVRQAKKFADKQNWAKQGRHMLLSADAYDQLVTDMIATKYRDNITIFNPETGELKKLMGFEIHVRAEAVAYTNAATPVVKAYGAAITDDDNDAILCWQERAVSRAKGAIKVYETIGSATDYGDIYSALVRVGGSKRRKTEVGVCAIVQAHAA